MAEPEEKPSTLAQLAKAFFEPPASLSLPPPVPPAPHFPHAIVGLCANEHHVFIATRSGCVYRTDGAGEWVLICSPDHVEKADKNYEEKLRKTLPFGEKPDAEPSSDPTYD